MSKINKAILLFLIGLCLANSSYSLYRYYLSSIPRFYVGECFTALNFKGMNYRVMEHDYASRSSLVRLELSKTEKINMIFTFEELRDENFKGVKCEE